MSKEIEYKFKLTDVHCQQLLASAFCASKAHIQPVITAYYDSPNGSLRQAGYALRLRELPEGFVQSLKGKGQAEGALHQHEEWDVSIKENRIYPEYIPIPNLRALVENLLAASQLNLIFVTDFIRQSWVFDYQQAKIELAIDRGVIKTRNKAIDIFELEVELITGEFNDLKYFVSQLLDKIPLVAEPQSKAERAYCNIP